MYLSELCPQIQILHLLYFLIKLLKYCVCLTDSCTWTVKSPHTSCSFSQNNLLKRDRVGGWSYSNNRSVNMKSGSSSAVQFVFGPRSYHLGSDSRVKTLISTGPSPPLPFQLQGQQLVLLPPEWAPCQRTQWPSDSQKRSRTVQKSCTRTLLSHNAASCDWLSRHLSLRLTDFTVHGEKVTEATPESTLDKKNWWWRWNQSHWLPPSATSDLYSIYC